MKRLTDLDISKEIAFHVKKNGGRTFFVGGCVRDLILGVECKDIDIEVHGISPSVLEQIIDRFGEKITIGVSFGIYNIKGHSIDIAIPRKESLRGTGHKDFDVIVDPFVGTQNAAIRRDFTINSLMQDVLTGEIIDHFNGINDLKNHKIRHVCEKTFIEDPLRVLRACQFAARLNFSVSIDTIELCKTMDLSKIPAERVVEELKKALLKSNKPSIFFETLRKMDQLDYWFKEVKDLIGVEQNPHFHQEGDVWTHTMMVLDVATKYRDKVNNPFGFMLSALTHDFGKPSSTKIINGVIHSYCHEINGIEVAKNFIKRLTNENELIKYVLNMTEYHMKPNILAFGNASIKDSNMMFDLSVDPLGLIFLAISDSQGMILDHPYVSHENFLLKRLEIYNEYMERPYVTGKDLIKAGLTPSINFSEILDYAHTLRLDGIKKEEAMKKILNYSKKFKWRYIGKIYLIREYKNADKGAKYV